MLWLVADTALPPSPAGKLSHKQHPQLVHAVSNRAQKHKMVLISKLLYCFETVNSKTKFAQGKNSTIYLLLPFGSIVEPNENEWIDLFGEARRHLQINIISVNVHDFVEV